ncbi:MAG: uroporphyrinogen decarboxylase family protein [Sphingomonadales bacterium]
MDAFERVYSALKGKPVDRLPVFPQIGDHAGIIKGLTYDVMYKDAEAAAQAHLDAVKLYGFDVVTIQVEPSWPIAEACGAGVTYPPLKCPWITDYLIQDVEGIDALEVPDFMATLSTRTMIEGTRILAERATVPVVAFMTGPLTFALQLMPYDKLIKMMVKDPDSVHRLVTKSTAIGEAYSKALKEAGATILMICEHDTQMMGPRHVYEFSIKYYEPLLNIYDYNMIHMCGRVTAHMKANRDALIALGKIDMINVGHDVNLAEMREVFGDEIGIAGNIDHIGLLPLAGKDEVADSCRTSIDEVGGHQTRRYMLAPGCEITADTPTENIKAYVDAAKGK